jgi:tetratricopeptide (TPR) repeat protein
MRIRKLAAISIVVLGSFAATNVSPSKTELEAMYSKAFHDFDANNFEQALKELDEIDARQPDLAESQNLRGVIYMRQRIYDKAEAALFEAVRIDPKFWNARFNLAEIPFLKKDWSEARKRFQQLLSANASDLQGDAAQLIQYKILLTYLMEGKENIVDSILAKFELSPETPAMHYANAAIALQRNDQKEAKDWIAKAEKDFSPQLNKLFAESVYEIGWLEKPAGQARASLPLTTGAERAAQAKAFANSRLEQAQQALQQRDYATAGKFVDEADTADPDQAPIINLRGEILMAQKKYEDAEAAFKKAAKLDPKFREAQYNLADIPFKKQDYAKARERFEALFEQIPGGDKNQASQIMKFKIFMTLLLEGKESRAQKMMEQFQFTGDTPALYYAQAAWEFKHNNPTKAADWIASAKKIYSPALNNLFGDAFYDLGWIESQGTIATAAPASEAATALSGQTESLPAIEPSPIPGAIASTSKAKEKAAPASATQPVPGMEATTSNAEPPASVAQAQTVMTPAAATAAGTPAKPEEIPAAPVVAMSPRVEAPVAPQTTTAEPAAAQPAASAPATALAPARVGELSQPRIGETRHPWLVGALLLAGLFLLAWVIVPELRRWFGGVLLYRRAAPVSGPRLNGLNFASTSKEMASTRSRLIGGPRRVSLQLKASEPSLRRGVAIARSAAVAPASPRAAVSEPVVARETAQRDSDMATQSLLEASVGAAVEPVETPRFDFAPESEPESPSESAAETSQPPAAVEPVETTQFDFAPEPEPETEPESLAEASASAARVESSETPQFDLAEQAEPDIALEPLPEPWADRAAEPIETPAVDLGADVDLAVNVTPISELEEPIEFEPSGNGEIGDFTAAAPEVFTAPEMAEPEPVPQGQPVPYQVPVAETETPLGEDVDAPGLTPINFESSIPQPTSNITMPITMPEPIQVPTAPVVRTPTPVGTSPQPAGAMHTAVQLTFSFEIASMQLTPTFKMGALQVRPLSKIVTMRLAPAQQAQPAMNLQVTFEVAKIQPSGGALGTLRLTPSQQQRPTPTGSSSFNVAGLQLVPNFEAAPVQLTPSGQGQAIVLVSAPFQIGTVEFSPSFEIASIVLNSTSRQVGVQLPGAPPPAGETPPLFEIANLQLTGAGEIGLMQLNLIGHGARRAAAAA